MNTAKAIANLKKFTKRLVRDGVYNRNDWKAWKQKPKNVTFMSKCFGYNRIGDMPSIVNLLDPDFHATLPLILLNYSDVAHNTLFKYEDLGWTETLRHCRGTVFDRTGKLVGLAFPKFFNRGEHPETKAFPDEPSETTVKHDGWLGIIFWYEGKLRITTRGRFEHRWTPILTAMLEKYVEANNWNESFPKDLTVLVEVIHPETEVHLDYQGQEKFVLIGAFDIRSRKKYHDHTYAELCTLGEQLGIEVTELWQCNSLDELVALVEDLTNKGKEGFVTRFMVNNIRTKSKFMSYVQLMKADKLSYAWLMQRIIDGNIDTRILDMPEEVIDQARSMLADVLKVKEIDGVSDKERAKKQREYLYRLYRKYPDLDPEQRKEETYKQCCGKLVRHLNTA
jgi:hypothetical protein